MAAPEEPHTAPYAETHQRSTEEETVALGERLAQELVAGDIVCISGELGAGKTALCRGIASGLGVNPSDVRSPTFSIAHEYRGAVEVLHFDCYRITKPEEALQIGWDDYLERQAVILIEWPEKIEALLPAGCIRVRITADGSSREITIVRGMP